MTTQTLQTLLWELPVPSTALLDGGAVFEKLPRREVAVKMSYEVDDGVRTVALVFEGVEGFKVTYCRARGRWMLEAYDRLVDAGETEWLGELKANLRENGGQSADLCHLVINFDDGPCYEIVCRGHRVDDLQSGS